jgi:hypothetical protein
MQTRRCTGGVQRRGASGVEWRRSRGYFVPGRLYSAMSIGVGTSAPRFKSKRRSESRPGINLRRSTDMAARFDDCISEPAFKPAHCKCLRRHNPHSFRPRLKRLQRAPGPIRDMSDNSGLDQFSGHGQPFPLLENEQSYVDKDSDQPTSKSAFGFDSRNVTGASRL